MGNFNSLERLIDSIIVQYFEPKKRIEFFEKTLLNSSIINTGSKVKLLMNFDDFDKKIGEKLRNLINIRNGFAHSNPYPLINLEVIKQRIDSLSVENKIDIMNSNGIIKSKSFEIEYDNLQLISSEVIVYLNQYKSNLDKKTESKD